MGQDKTAAARRGEIRKSFWSPTWIFSVLCGLTILMILLMKALAGSLKLF